MYEYKVEKQCLPLNAHFRTPQWAKSQKKKQSEGVRFC